MTPRALAGDTTALLKPLSCHAIAAASEAGAPCSAASALICPAPSRVGVGTGLAGGTHAGRRRRRVGARPARARRSAA